MPTTDRAKRRGILRRFNESEGTKATVSLSQIIGALAGVAAVLVTVVLAVQAVDDPGDHPTSESEAGSTTGSRESRLSPADQASCWNSMREPVSCAVAHQFEVVERTVRCERLSVLRWLGGTPQLDVAAFHLDSAWLPGSCVVDVSSSIATRFRDLLQTPAGDGIRICQSGQLRTPATYSPTNCATPHIRELYSTVDVRQSSQATCESVAADYVGQSLDQVKEDFRIEALVEIDGDLGSPRCALELITGSPLVASVRNLGNGPIPREP